MCSAKRRKKRYIVYPHEIDRIMRHFLDFQSFSFYLFFSAKQNHIGTVFLNPPKKLQWFCFNLSFRTHINMPQ